VYDGRFGVAGLGDGGAAAALAAAVTVTAELLSNKLGAAVGGACGGAEGAGESKALRISAAVVFCGWEAGVGVVVALLSSNYQRYIVTKQIVLETKENRGSGKWKTTG
jgi:hypothetical protein